MYTHYVVLKVSLNEISITIIDHFFFIFMIISEFARNIYQESLWMSVRKLFLHLDSIFPNSLRRKSLF